jgi:hypothetical protein
LRSAEPPPLRVRDCRFRARRGPWGLIERGRAGAPPVWQPVHYRNHLGQVGDPCDAVGPSIKMYQPTEDDLVSHIPHEVPLSFARRLVAEIFRQSKEAGAGE